MSWLPKDKVDIKITSLWDQLGFWKKLYLSIFNRRKKRDLRNTLDIDIYIQKQLPLKWIDLDLKPIANQSL